MAHQARPQLTESWAVAATVMAVVVAAVAATVVREVLQDGCQESLSLRQTGTRGCITVWPEREPLSTHQPPQQQQQQSR